MAEANPLDQPVAELVEGKDDAFTEEEKEEVKAIQDLLETNHPLVTGLRDRMKVARAKAKEAKQKGIAKKIKRKEEDLDLVFELIERVYRMRMTFQKVLHSLSTEVPPGLVLNMRKIEKATCLDDLENLFGPTEVDIDELVKSGGKMADLIKKFPQISLEDDESESAK